MTNEKKSTEEVLFPEAQVGNITVKPWSFGILFKISSMLESVLDKINEKNLTPELGYISYFDMLHIFTIANQEVRKIIALTVDKSEEEIDALSMEEGMQIAIIIYLQNSTVLKNVLSSLLTKTNPPTVGQKEESKLE